MSFKKLVDCYKSGNFGIFVGSGVSQASDLPSWEGLLLELIELAREHNAPENRLKELISLIGDSSKYLLIAEELKDFLQQDLYKYVRSKFDSNSVVPSELLMKIISLNHKFIITTNYDTLIEKAFVKTGANPNDFTYKDAASINYNLMTGEKFILKAHGDARRSPNEIIITEKDYRNILFRERGYQSVLQTLFSTCHILFIGASLKDPELRLLLGFIHDVFHGGSPDHFAFMPNEGLTDTEIERWRKDYNIHVIPYNPENNHLQLLEKIDQLIDQK